MPSSPNIFWWLVEDDKSKFLAQAGFTEDNPDQLKQAILKLVQTYDAISDRQDKYGTYYRVEGYLIGSERALAVVTIWIERAKDSYKNNFRFSQIKTNG
jgi:hypothetical protein